MNESERWLIIREVIVDVAAIILAVVGIIGIIAAAIFTVEMVTQTSIF